MNRIAKLTARFREEESGAAMVEYSILLGIITVAVIGTILGVGAWVSAQWTGLCTDLSKSTTTCTAK